MFNFFNTLANVAANIIANPKFNLAQRVTNVVQRLSQVVAGQTGAPQQPADTPATQPTSTPVTTLTSAERERLRRQRAEATRQRKLARMEAEFERNMVHNEAGNEQPLKYSAGYLAKPADADIRWIGDKEAHKVIQAMKDTPALVDTMLSIASSPKAAFDLLLAQEIDLPSDVIALLVDKLGNKEFYAKITGSNYIPVFYQGSDVPLPFPELPLIYTRERLNQMATELGITFDLQAFSDEDLYRILVNHASTRIKNDSEALIGSLDIEIDYTKLHQIPLEDLANIVSIRDIRNDLLLETDLLFPPAIVQVEIMQNQRMAPVLDTLFILSVLRASNSIPEDAEQRGLDEFQTLSDIVSTLTNNQKNDYFYVMNTLLLGYSSPGDMNVALSATTIRHLNQTSASVIQEGRYLSAEQLEMLNRLRVIETRDHYINRFLIGSKYLDDDYNQFGGEYEQISNHIWAYLSTAASGGIGASQIATLFHDQIQTQQLQDYHAGLVAADLGSLLGKDNITPQSLGTLVNKSFRMGYEEFNNRFNLISAKLVLALFSHEITPEDVGQIIDSAWSMNYQEFQETLEQDDWYNNLLK